MRNTIKFLLCCMMALACAGTDQSEPEPEAVHGGADAGVELGQTAQAYSVPTTTTGVRMLGSRPSSNSNASNIACRNGQAASSDCRFVIAADQDSGFYVFVDVGIDEASYTGFDSVGQLADANSDLDFVLNELEVDFPGSVGGTLQRYVFTKTTYADSTIALRKAALGSVLTATTQDVYKFMRVGFHGCSAALAESPAHNGTWRSCTSGIINLDAADYAWMGGTGVSLAQKRRYLIADGILVALGFGMQGVRSNQKNYVSLTTASVGQNNYWGPFAYSENPTRCIADWACYGALQTGPGAVSRCDGVSASAGLFTNAISTCTGTD